MTTPSSSPPLRCDARGSLLVVGAVMGVTLVIGLSYVVAVGNAIFEQETLQLAADATAFHSAVWHARGMNLLSLLNIVLAATFAVHVSFRAAELFLVLVMAACLPGAGVCTGHAATVLEKVLRADIVWSRRMVRTGRAITYAEQAVAVTIPVVATQSGLKKTRDFYKQRGVASQSAVSLSLLPTVVDATLLAEDKPPGFQGLSQLAEPGGIKPRAGYGLVGGNSGGLALAQHLLPSLPVEDESKEGLCFRAGEFATTQVGGVMGLATGQVGGGLSSDGTPGWVSQLASTGVGYLLSSKASAALFCTPISQILDDFPELLVDAVRKALGFSPGRLLSKLSKVALQGIDLGMVSDAVKRAVSGRGGPQTDRAEVRAVKLWGLTGNGRLFLRTWASAQGEAGGSFFGLLGNLFNPDPGSDRATASAEYYAECYDGSPVLPRSCRDDAMWRIGWTARMRRFRGLHEEAGLEFGETVERLLRNTVKTALGDLGTAILTQEFIRHAIDHPYSPVAQVIDEATGWLTGGFSTLVGNPVVDSRGGQSAPEADVIH